MEKWAESVSVKIEVSKARIEKYKSHGSQAISLLSDPYSKGMHRGVTFHGRCFKDNVQQSYSKVCTSGMENLYDDAC